MINHFFGPIEKQCIKNPTSLFEGKFRPVACEAHKKIETPP